ncbi:anti-sigma factor [Paenibacillus faecalis]|uniref:anti-sigma factor n=1 Tax=Paenibacillus faecalis TaxID=2079532 RepID=UPI000D1065DA|nr:anti-sigma factor [Paenibacillus faecalis]
MSDEFRQKLKDYEAGKLSEDERLEIEKELEKLEMYQAHLDELLGQEGSGAFSRKEDVRREAKIIRRGKWKARLNTVLSVLVILILVSWASNIFNSFYFGEGEPNRMDIYSDVASSAIKVTYPNVSVHLNSSMGGFFTYELYGDMKKQVGDESYNIGDYSLSFWFGRPNSQQMTWFSDNVTYFFNYPDDPNAVIEQDWRTLEKLPEGTVAEVYVSLDDYYTTDEILQKFEGKNMEPVWFAVDAGFDLNEHPIGFPYNPMWHHDDLTITSSTEEFGKSGKIVSRSGVYPAVETYGSGELRNDNFIKTLKLLQKYSSITRQAAPFLKIDKAIEYIESSGVQIYGVVITGPTKELLKLNKEPWVKDIHVGEARLWNWQK